MNFNVNCRGGIIVRDDASNNTSRKRKVDAARGCATRRELGKLNGGWKPKQETSRR
jgi:hypothetical protein